MRLSYSPLGTQFVNFRRKICFLKDKVLKLSIFLFLPLFRIVLEHELYLEKIALLLSVIAKKVVCNILQQKRSTRGEICGGIVYFNQQCSRKFRNPFLQFYLLGNCELRMTIQMNSPGQISTAAAQRSLGPRWKMI